MIDPMPQIRYDFTTAKQDLARFRRRHLWYRRAMTGVVAAVGVLVMFAKPEVFWHVLFMIGVMLFVHITAGERL
jgi:hypothetical protein